jgi:uncharacterized membrane protein
VNEYHVALFFHLLGAFLLVGGTVVAGVAFEAARRRNRATEIALLLGLTRIGVVLVGVGALLALGFGLWLVRLGDWGFGTGWVVAALVLFAVMAVVGAAGGKRPKQARRLAAELEAAPTPELRALLDDRASRALNYVSALLLLAIIALMVFKPGS